MALSLAPTYRFSIFTDFLRFKYENNSYRRAT